MSGFGLSRTLDKFAEFITNEFLINQKINQFDRRQQKPRIVREIAENCLSNNPCESLNYELGECPTCIESLSFGAVVSEMS